MITMWKQLMVIIAIALSACAVGLADDAIFSGPQVGDKLVPFKVKGFFEPDAGKELDFVKASAGGPILLVFIHEVNRESLGFARQLTRYSIGVEGLQTGVTWLADDVTEAENNLKRTGHALQRKAPTGISMDGGEGPGVYGLNRNVSLTVLVGKEDRVTANFALVQPSIQADLPRVLEAIAGVTGGTVATLDDLLIVRHPRLQGPLMQLADRDASPEDVDRHATNIETLIKRDETAGKELGRVTSQILSNGTLSKQGTTRAQEYLEKWAQEYGGSASP